jgi:spore coat polysaccharide biosynthesis protein SpsF
MHYEKVIAVVQARLASRGLPGKVLLPIGSASVLERTIERVERLQRIDGFLVATTREGSDDRIEQLCLARGWACRRGSEFDVLDRIWRAAHSVQAEHVLLVGGDQPLFAWQQAESLVDHHLRNGADITHNLPSHGSGLPVGTGCAVVRMQALEVAWREANGPGEREHALEFLLNRPRRFRTFTLRAPPELARPTYSFDIEDSTDLERLRRVQRALGEHGCVDLARAIALFDTDAGARGVAM